VLMRGGQRWRTLAGKVATGIPATIQAMLLARVDRLPQEVRRLAQEAAVIGPRFDATLLKTVTSDPGRLEAGCELLCDAEIIEEVAGSGSGSSQSYRFTQTLLQDVIYQNLLLQRRTDIHGRVGAALEQLCGDKPERLEDLAVLGHHFAQSAERERGAHYLQAAGDRARMIYANDDALRFYERALTALGAIGQTPLKLAIAERIADLSGPAGRRQVAHHHYEAVLLAYRQSADRVASARVLRKVGRLLWDVGKRDNAESRYAEAAALLDGADAPIEQAHLWQERGRQAFRSGDHSLAAKWADAALDCVRTLTTEHVSDVGRDATLVTAEALNTKAVALARLGRNREAVGQVERSIELAEAAGLLGAACRGYTNLGVLYTTIDPAKAMEVCRRGLDVARHIGDLGFQARLLANLAVACCTFTDRCPTEGVPAAEKAIEIDRALDQREHLPVPLIVLGQIHQCNGRPELAVGLFHEALDVAREMGEPPLLFPCYDGLATLNLDLDNLAEAERYFSLAQGICAQHGLDPEALVVLPFLD
ncbi:adenylate/guanylate cyclase domain-containing protein, partial [Mesorhizobium sp. M7A.T.Ca.TU.009.01.3.1]